MIEISSSQSYRSWAYGVKIVQLILSPIEEKGGGAHTASSPFFISGRRPRLGLSRLTSSMVLTLFVVPAMYLIIENMISRKTRKKEIKPSA